MQLNITEKNKIARRLLSDAKYRSKKYNIEINIDLSDIEVPDNCPILGIPLFCNSKHSGPNSPSIDRIDSSKGYIKNNIQVISHKANTMKSDANLDELVLFAMWVLGISNERFIHS